MVQPPTASAQVAETISPDDIGRENAVLRELVTVYRHLSGLALQDADIETVTRLLAQRTDATVAVVDPTMAVLAAAGPEGSDEAGEKAAARIRDYVVHPRLSRVLSATGQARRALRLPDVGQATAVIVAPILVGDEVPAYLLTLDDGERNPSEDVSLLVTEHAATICGVILGRERVVTGAARRVRADLVEGLLLGRGRDEDEVERWARHLGYDPARDHRVVSVAFLGLEPGGESTATERLGAAVEHFVTSRVPEAIFSTREAETVAVLPEPHDGDRTSWTASALGSACAGRMEELFGQWVVTIGIGGRCRGPLDIARSYAEARRTVDAAWRLQWYGRVVAFDDLGIYRILLQVPDLGELRSFADGVLGPLVRYERQRGVGYLSTLACYFRENSSPQRASQGLFVHPNTVAYRIKRVEEITGLDFDSYRDRLMAQVALEILDALGGEA